MTATGSFRSSLAFRSSVEIVLSILTSLRIRRCRVWPYCLAFEALGLGSNPILNRAVLKMSEALMAPGGFSPHKIRMQGKPTGQALRCKSILRGLFVLREQSSSVLDISPRALAPVVRYVSCRRHGTHETATSATVILYRLCGMAGGATSKWERLTRVVGPRFSLYLQ